MVGDYFAQNIDVVQPGPIAPWYQRYGHSMDAIDIDGDGVQDMMVLMGGFASYPSNDVWVTEDGNNWLYTGLAPWSPRAWHSTTVFNGKLWMMGGTPLNNEVWMLDAVTRVSRRAPPTRSLYSNYTYRLQWQQLPDAPWSPRVGAGLVAHWYFPPSLTVADSRERLVLVGGYGGWLDERSVNANANANANAKTRYDGFYCRSDAWESYDGSRWSLLNASTSLKGRAWFGMSVLHDQDPRVGVPKRGDAVQAPKMYIFGGGYIGSSTRSARRVTSMAGFADAHWSRDGASWTRISYEEGGGVSAMPFFSSQEWAKTAVDTEAVYLGLWGLTVESFNFSSKAEHPGDFLLIAGDYTRSGDMSAGTFRSLSGLFCDTDGVVCMNQGVCLDDGCACNASFVGDNCELSDGSVVSAAARGGAQAAGWLLLAMGLMAALGTSTSL
jgi:hypothetical protein